MEVTNISLSPDSEYLLAWSTKQNTAAVFDLKLTINNVEEILCVILNKGWGYLIVCGHQIQDKYYCLRHLK
jgi:hypothetical protein